MSFKGTRQNGRTLGSQNKATKEIRERFKNLLDDNMEQIVLDLKALEPKDRINALLQLAKYVIPQMRSVEVTEKENRNFTPVVIEMSNYN